MGGIDSTILYIEAHRHSPPLNFSSISTARLVAVARPSQPNLKSVSVANVRNQHNSPFLFASMHVFGRARGPSGPVLRGSNLNQKLHPTTYSNLA